MRKQYFLFILSIFTICSLIGCKRKAQPIQETLPVYETQVRDNLKELKEKSDSLMRDEYLGIVYLQNGQQQLKKLSYKDDVYKSIPNIPYTYAGTKEENDEIIYVYMNNSPYWEEDIMPQKSNNDYIEETEETTQEEVEVNDEFDIVEEIENEENESNDEYEIIEENETEEIKDIVEEIEETTKEQQTTKKKETETTSKKEQETTKKVRIVNILDEIEEIEKSN